MRALKKTDRAINGVHLWFGALSGIVSILLLAGFIGHLYYAKQKQILLYSRTLLFSQGLAELRSSLSDIDTGLRGYLLTDEELFLEPYLTGKEKIPGKIRHLLSLVSESPTQLRHAKELEKKIPLWLERMESWRKSLRDGKTSLEKGRELQGERDVLYQLLQEMESVENSLLSQRTQNETWAFQSMRISWRIHEYHNLVISMEKYQRGFLLYGSDTFLQDFEKAESQAATFEGYLTAITKPYPLLSAEFSKSIHLLNRWREEACLPEIEAKKSGKDVRKLILDGNGRHLMDELRASLAKMEEGARNEFESAQARQNRETSRHRATVLGMVLVAILIIAWTTWCSIRIHRRQVGEILRMGEEIKSREEQFLSFMNYSPTVSFIKDELGQFVFINSSFEKFLNINAKHAVGKTDLDVFPEKVARKNRENDALVLQENRCMEFFENVPTPDGNKTDWWVFKFPFVDQLGRRFLGGIALDITEKKRMDQALETERQRLLVTLTSIGDGVISTDMEGRVRLMNRVAEQLTGWSQSESFGKPLEEVFNIINETTRKPVENPVMRVIESGTIMGLANHTLLIAKDGIERPIADSAAPIMDAVGQVTGVVLVFRNVEQEKKNEKERVRAEKMETVGLLAGGIAHDFNNILTVLMGNMTLARILIEGDKEASERLRDAEQAALRARDLAQQLLTFSKGGAPIRKSASIGDLIRDTSVFFLRGSHTRCELEADTDLWNTEIDASQISQVIENLILNAEQSMPDGGRILIRCLNSKREDLEHVIGLASNPFWVVVSITDQGIGIREEYLEKIFEPYFTTKQKGSGLGLATVYSIMKNHEGHITVDSTPGKGTTFHLYFPASEKVKEPLKERVTTELRHVPCPVLVLEDDPMIQKLVTRLLSPLGYTVTVASDGKEAVALYKVALSEGKRFGVVITDLTIPGGMGGKETIRELLQLDPQVRAIVSSGYANDPIMANYRDFGFSAVVTKPYSALQLRNVVAELVSQKQF